MVLQRITDRPSAGFPRRSRLLKHSDFQRVYQEAKKSFSGNITALYRARTDQDLPGPRVGFAVGKVLGGAVARNRIRRRMRAAVASQLGSLTRPVDVVLHPRKSVLDLDFVKLSGEIQQLFAAVQKGAGR
ncbi:MAG TPA: ribonuclease P protein component [Candidatus Angelobacter sp.]|nr:ribonuclease P protein component [Candidatus Angelobacter sp.]